MLVLTIGLQMFLHVSAIGRSTRDSSRAKQTLVVDFISFKLNGRNRMCEEQVRTIRLVHTSNRKLLLGIVAFSSCFQLKVDNGHILGRNTKSRLSSIDGKTVQQTVSTARRYRALFPLQGESVQPPILDFASRGVCVQIIVNK